MEEDKRQQGQALQRLEEATLKMRKGNETVEELKRDEMSKAKCGDRKEEFRGGESEGGDKRSGGREEEL